MNCLFILVLLGCCGRYPARRGCCAENQHCCREPRHEQVCCRMRRCEENKKDECNCQNKIEPRMQRYDEGMCSYGCMDSVPEMRETLPYGRMNFSDKCGCSERN